MTESVQNVLVPWSETIQLGSLGGKRRVKNAQITRAEKNATENKNAGKYILILAPPKEGGPEDKPEVPASQGGSAR
jgi:hypothetical protein